MLASSVSTFSPDKLSPANTVSSVVALWANKQHSVDTKSAVNAIMGIPNFGTDFIPNWKILKEYLGMQENESIPEIIAFEAISSDGSVVKIEPAADKNKGLAFVYFLLVRGMEKVQPNSLPNTGEQHFSRFLTPLDKKIATAFFAQYVHDKPGTGTHPMIDALLQGNGSVFIKMQLRTRNVADANTTSVAA